LPAAQSQRGVEVELQEPHQADAALRLPDVGGELLVGGAGRELAEQLPDVGLVTRGLDRYTRIAGFSVRPLLAKQPVSAGPSETGDGRTILVRKRN
jgi:hypothetical protein